MNLYVSAFPSGRLRGGVFVHASEAYQEDKDFLRLSAIKSLSLARSRARMLSFSRVHLFSLSLALSLSLSLSRSCSLSLSL